MPTNSAARVLCKSTEAINYDDVFVHPQQSREGASRIETHPVAMMDTVALICLHMSARQLAQAAVWTGDQT